MHQQWKALKRIKEAGINVITWDSDLLAKDKELRTAYVGTNKISINVKLTQFEATGWTICIQSGGASAANHNERMQGIRDTLAGTSGTTLLAID